MEPDRIAGEWKDFEFKKIEEEDYPVVMKHLRENFYKDEPIQQIVGMTEERASDLDKRLGNFLRDQLSFMAIDKNTENIAGVMIIIDCKKDKIFPEYTATSPLTIIIRSALIKLHNSVDIFAKFGVDHYADIYVISVSKDFRGGGLATEMYNRGISMLSDMGYPLVESSFSNPISRKIGEKLGFKEVTRAYFAEIKNEKGEKSFPNATPEQFINVTVLKLQGQ